MNDPLCVTVTMQDGEVAIECEATTPALVVERALSEYSGAQVLLGEGHAGDVLTNGMRLGIPLEPEVAPHGLLLQVVSGPDCGQVFTLPLGRHLVGRECAITWDDPALSREHLAIEVGADGVRITDLSSTNGSCLEGHAGLGDGPVAWRVGDLLMLGDSIVVLCEAPSAFAMTELAEPGWRAFIRPPRIRGQAVEEVVEIPAAPPQAPRRRFPMIALLAPIVMGIGLAFVMRSPMYLAFALMSPVILTANHLADRRNAVRSRRHTQAEYERDVARAQAAVESAVGAEQARLRDELPDAAQVLLTGVGPGLRLWERRPRDADVLRLRLALADQPSSVVVRGGEAEPPMARWVPQDLCLREVSVLGVAGEPGLTDGLLRWLIGQVATYHAPGEVSMAFLTTTGGPEWSWLRWLPHLRTDGGVRIGHDPASVTVLLGEIVEVIEARGADPSATHPPLVVVMHDYDVLRSYPEVTTVIAGGPRLRVYPVCVATSQHTVPEQAGAVVVVEPEGTTVRIDGVGVAEQLTRESVGLAWAQRLSRGMAALVGVSGGEVSARVPASARLLDLLAVDTADDQALRLRWSRQPRSTEVVIGAGAGADGVVGFDLAWDSPHVLIAGMTGSGKTELLQSIVCSLAAGNRPEWLNMVLIDYKGDSAFKDCVDLPHVVGKVTDLDARLVERALRSLQAELRFRKRMLAQADAKDIEEYQARASTDPSRPPLPRLVLVIDEFAELSQELPEFMDGLISIAQVGRSLGVHLILATQRPSGVVSASIRANTGVRIALRVADASDSTDVLGSTEAATIPTRLPGRGYLRLNAGGCKVFQAGRVGGPVASRGETAPIVSPVPWERLGEGWGVASSGAPTVGATDLSVLVRALGRVAAAEGIPRQRQPWLDPLPEVIELPEAPAGPPGLSFPLGLRDEPMEQRQTPATFDLERDSHLYVVGIPGSGRSQALLTLAGSIASRSSPDDVHLYALDCGAGELEPLARLPHCGAVVARTESERAVRLLERLTAEMGQRQQSRGRGPRLVLMLDGWEGFLGSLGDVEGMEESVRRLLREGAGVGIHLVIAGDRTLIINARMSALTDRKLVLRLADRGDYVMAGLASTTMSGRMPPGRCWDRDGVETQLYRVSTAALRRWADKAPSALSRPPFRVDALPPRATLGLASSLPHEPAGPCLVVAVGGDELRALGPDLRTTSCFVVAGPSRSGRSSVLLGAARSALADGLGVVVIAPRPSPLRELGGVATIFEAAPSPHALKAATTASACEQVVLVIDDGESLRECEASPFLLAVVRREVPEVFLLLGGHTDGLATGLTGWQVEARKARQGLLLSPQEISDGELIGVRLSRGAVRGPVRPGRGLFHRGDGVAISVATLAPDPVGGASLRS